MFQILVILLALMAVASFIVALTSPKPLTKTQMDKALDKAFEKQFGIPIGGENEVVELKEPYYEPIAQEPELPFQVYAMQPLHFRELPGVEHNITGYLMPNRFMEIYDTAQALDGGSWGRTAFGWINLRFCSRVEK